MGETKALWSLQVLDLGVCVPVYLVRGVMSGMSVHVCHVSACVMSVFSRCVWSIFLRVSCIFEGVWSVYTHQI